MTGIYTKSVSVSGYMNERRTQRYDHCNMNRTTSEGSVVYQVATTGFQKRLLGTAKT
jgi:hypothetical protein